MRRPRDSDGPKSEGSQPKSLSQRIKNSSKLLRRKSQAVRRPQTDVNAEQRGEAVTPALLNRRTFATTAASPSNAVSSNDPTAGKDKEIIAPGIDKKDVIALQAAINREHQLVHRSKTPIRNIKDKYRKQKDRDTQVDHFDEVKCRSLPKIPIGFDSEEMRFSDAEEDTDEESSLVHRIHGSLVLGVATPRTLRSMKFKISLPTVLEEEVSGDTGTKDFAGSDG
ncbi:hypothetical protein BWQ96_01492 [Gracilariopsis chorda]|uniref:Uncharacterized protein n=1 Tax=Gracilariopsis chorda TaxID=448386 RepID=A0A2V3J5J0_9FLOR|nr:hypothetical protein BWQ96_01492 [Gracilariopsis chorda]|eukprot:PXF48640.1 hypothetical protein BWQ96_01492 [Gracilariopsis chorda]